MIKIKKNLCYIFAISIFSIVLFTELKAMEKESLIDKPRSKQLRKKISLTAIVEAAKKKTYNKFSNNMIQTKKELSYFEELPIELKEYILSFLPGDNRGLNYLVRCKKFFPTSVIAEKIQAAFLNRLSKIDGPLSGSLAYAAMHFFEVSKKGHINSLYHLFGDHLDLEKTIPAKVRKSSCWDTEDNSEKLTYSAIEEALKLFVNNTQSAWNELIKKLYEKNKPLISFSGFCLIRKKIIEHFVKRLNQHFKKNVIVDCSQQLCNLCHYCELPFNPCPLIPGGSCCIIGAINAVTGFGVWSCSELACVLLTSVGGFGCAVIGGAVCCLAYDPNCSDEPCCEIIHRNPSEYCPGCYNNNDGYPMAYYIFKSLFNAYAELQLESKLDGLN